MTHPFDSSVQSTSSPRRSFEPPDVYQTSVELRATPFVTGWNLALARPMQIDVDSIQLSSPQATVFAVSVHSAKPRVRAFSFTPPVEIPSLNETPPGHESPKSAPDVQEKIRVPNNGRPTRIRPPDDVIKLDDRLRYLLQPSLETLLSERSLEFPFPPFPYQFEGVAFLFARHAAVLADEMGLGKTMQAITAIRLLLRCGELSTVLLVCPKPLVTNWQREFELWAPEIPITIVEGDQNRRAWLWQLPRMPVKIANYELLRQDRHLFDRDASEKPELHFDLVVLDETQRIKNRTSATSQAARAISRSRNWAMTGTPVENSADDLVGIFEYLAPGFLSPEMKPHRMGHTIRDFVLRRTKDQVLSDMPPKLFRDADLELTSEQRETYELAEKEGILRLTEMGQSATIQHVFELVLRLKQICNFDTVTDASSKLERLEADLEEIAASGRKAIVFSQWVQTLQKLSHRLKRFGPLEYHGRIPSGRRDAVIQRFRESSDASVILMSYGAGGVGLNLQFASYVFLFDRWWNPAVEDQAINRAHRIGVPEAVTITRMLMLGTIEERIHLILEEKRDLFDTIFSDNQPHGKLGMTQQEVFGLFDLRGPAGPIDFAA